MSRLAPAILVLVLPCALVAEDKKPDPFTSKEGKFSVAFPDKPTQRTNTVKTGTGELELHRFSVDRPDRSYLLTYSDSAKGVPADGRDKFLTDVADRIVKNLKGTAASNEKITLGKSKHPGREVKIELADKKLYRARLFVVGDRLYQVVALGPEEFVKGKAVDDFLNSFAVDE